jgi:hypothetical protein
MAGIYAIFLVWRFQREKREKSELRDLTFGFCVDDASDLQTRGTEVNNERKGEIGRFEI